MPEITVLHIVIIAVVLIIGTVLGWVLRGNRAVSEKTAINVSWQEQLHAHRSEHQRLMEQNKSLMEQNSQYQASNKDAKMRASELSEALKEAFARRDELQRQIKDIRNNLELAVSERNRLKNDMQSRSSRDDSMSAALRERDEKIFKLSRELENWQERLPPLLERYRNRDEDAKRLQAELDAARERIAALEEMVGSDQTRVEPVDPDSMADGMDASNEPIASSQNVELLPADQIFASGQDDDAGDMTEDDDDAFPDRHDGAAEAESPNDAHADGSDDDFFAGLGEFEAAREDSDADDDVDDEDGDEADFDNVVAHTTDDVDFSSSIGRDDLKLIKGVGPAIEKTLNEMGIFRFDQIAEMSEYDINRVAHRLKGFRSRIYREDWIGQARELQDRKASGQS
jgi:predicted flap endonuclease-1-like 5' DNA nuclease